MPDASAPVDVNMAGLDELDTLPGIGPATATAIIQYRDENGPFASVDDLESVPGIGPVTLGAIRELVTV
ncbi:MAG: helix-hairpin-helix domain-containing protein [Ilumatobacteraceae bacterium]